MFNYFDYFNKGFIFGATTDKYNPYINYSWSQTLTVGANQQIKDTGTAGLNLQQFFGQGCWFNGIDQAINLSSIPTIGSDQTFNITFVADSTKTIRLHDTNNSITGGRQFLLQAISGSLQIYKGISWETISPVVVGTQYILNCVYTASNKTVSCYVNGLFVRDIIMDYHYSTGSSSFRIIASVSNAGGSYFNGIIKDLYMFDRVLTQPEIDKYNNQPNQFFMDSLEDSSCVLAMPMCEKNNIVRNYKNNTDYPITNYLATCRTNAQRLSYGLQTSGFKRDSNGLILSKSNYLECDGVGIATRVGHNETVKVKTTVNPSSLAGTILSGGISLLTTGMSLNQDNIITLENQLPTVAVTFGNGFSGTIKEYKEEK